MPRLAAGVALVVASAVAVIVQCYGLYRPEGPTLIPLPHADKISHLLGFALPVALVLSTIGWFAGSVTRRAEAIVVVVFAVQAMASELAQGQFISNRSGDVVDLAADALGIGLGVVLARAAARGSGDGRRDRDRGRGDRQGGRASSRRARSPS